MGLHRASKSQLEVDEHGFRPFKKTYHPKSQTIQQPLDKELEVLQQSKPTHSASIPPSPQVAPIQQSPVQQPTPSQYVVEPDQQLSDNQQVTTSLQLSASIPHLELDAPFLPIRNGFDVLSVEQDIVRNVDTSNNIALGVDPIREDD